MHLEWYLWIALVVLLFRIPFMFVSVQRAADDRGTSLAAFAWRSLELFGTVAALVAVLAHGTGSW